MPAKLTFWETSSAYKISGLKKDWNCLKLAGQGVFFRNCAAILLAFDSSTEAHGMLLIFPGEIHNLPFLFLLLSWKNYEKVQRFFNPGYSISREWTNKVI